MSELRIIEQEVDLFGAPLPVETPTKGKRKTAKPWGYFAPPGTGPAGETCSTCRHLYRKRMAKTYLKCDRSQAKWTGGRASDILARSPACSGWEAAT